MAYQPTAINSKDKKIIDNYKIFLDTIMENKEDAIYNNKNRKNNFSLNDFNEEGNIKKRESLITPSVTRLT